MQTNKTFFYCFLVLLLSSVWSCKKSSDPAPAPIPVVPKLSFTDIALSEGNSAGNKAQIGLYLSEPTTDTVKVYWSTEDGSAKAGEDYVAVTNGVVIFLPGETSKPIEISIISDSYMELNDKFYFNIDSISKATSAVVKGSVTIENDDTYTAEEVADGFITPMTYPGMTLTWSDEFNGASLDMSNWTCELGGGGWGNNELEVYTSSTDNVFTSNGYLTIRALKNPYTSQYTSARIVTKGKKDFKYGRIDIRAKMPKGQGVWPALWMLGSNISSVSWPACGEIDIMENLGQDTKTVYGTIHYNDGGHKYKGSNYVVASINDYNQKFHVFTIMWQENSIDWYVDYHKYFSANSSTIKFDAFNLNQFFIFNVAVGGAWPGNPDGTTVFPQEMVVDYVRVFN